MKRFTAIRTIFLAWLFALVFGGTAHAQPQGFSRSTAQGGKLGSESLLNRSVKDRKVTRSGRIADLGSIKVAADAKGTTQSISKIAKEVFREHDDVVKKARGNRGIVGNVRSVDEVYELEDRVILVRTTAAVISDANEVRRVAPALVSRKGSARAEPLSSLSAASRAGLKAFRTEARAYPNGHPLREAANKGEEALYQAIVAGLGEIEIVDTVVMPKGVVPVTNGRVAVNRRGDGTFRLQAPGKSPPSNGPSGSIETIPIGSGTGPGSFVSTIGEHSSSARLLNGFTEGHMWEWERRWNFPSGHLEVGASAAYGVGLRIPIVVETTMTPKHIYRWGTTAGPGDTAEVQITARTLDGNSSHYTSAGLQSSQVFGGKEFVLQLGFGYKVQFRALWANLLDIDEWKDLINESKNFTPPQSTSWTPVASFWIPAKATNSRVKIPAVLDGRIQAGVRLDAKGSLDLTIEGRMEGQVIPVSLGANAPAASRTLQFPNPNTTRKVKVHVPPAANVGTRRNFGFEIRDLRYHADLSVVPGAKVVLESLVPGFKGHSWTTELWIDKLRLQLGGLSLGPHAGTKTTHGHEAGRANYHLEEKQVITRPAD
jgi:hypothetical protein